MRAVSVALRTVLILAALAVVAISFAMNGAFWWRQFPDDVTSRALFVTFSAVAGTLRIGIPAIAKLHGRQLWRALLVPFILAFCYDVWSGLGYVGMMRDDASRPALSTEAARTDAQRKRDEAAAKLGKLPSARPRRIVEAELSRAETEAGGCKSSRAAGDKSCQRVFDLRSEVATAIERDDLEKIRDEYAEKLLDAGTPKDTQPQITQLARGLRNFGLVVPPAVLEIAWSVLLLLFIEFAPAFVIWAMVRMPAPPKAAAPAPADVLPVGGSFARPAPRARTRPASSGDGVLTYLQSQTPDAAGWIVISQRPAAAAIGISPAEVNRQLADLAAAGAIRRDPNSRRTAVQLI